MLMVAPSGRENDDNSEDTPNSSFVTEVVIGREPLLLVVLAGGIIAVLPLIVLFIIFQRQFVEGIAHSGIKG